MWERKACKEKVFKETTLDNYVMYMEKVQWVLMSRPSDQ
jgi:hypothetical protein